MSTKEAGAQPLTVADRLYALAESNGFQRRGLSARLASACGISDKAVYRWLANESFPSRRHAATLARLLGCSAAYLLFGEPSDDDAVGNGNGNGNGDVGERIEPLPAQLVAIHDAYRAGKLDADDLATIHQLTRMLISKNASSARMVLESCAPDVREAALDATGKLCNHFVENYYSAGVCRATLRLAKYEGGWYWTHLYRLTPLSGGRSAIMPAHDLRFDSFSEAYAAGKADLLRVIQRLMGSRAGKAHANIRDARRMAEQIAADRYEQHVH